SSKPTHSQLYQVVAEHHTEGHQQEHTVEELNPEHHSPAGTLDTDGIYEQSECPNQLLGVEFHLRLKVSLISASTPSNNSRQIIDTPPMPRSASDSLKAGCASESCATNHAKDAPESDIATP